MDFFDVIHRRRSIRAYSSKPVAEDALARILEAANAAPSAGNLQAYEIYLVEDAGTRAELARAAYDQMFLAQAPAALVFCTHAARCERYGRRGERLYAIQDATIACAFAMLAAATLGIATVWVGAFDTDAIRRIVQAPAGIDPVAVLPIGYAAEGPAPPGRRPLNQLVHRVASPDQGRVEGSALI